jgi:signal transduction histidine kinase/DNA-binding response OmpR family regulator
MRFVRLCEQCEAPGSVTDDVSDDKAENRSGSADWLLGGGEMGDLVRAFDWSKTSLGPIRSWPQSLRTAVSLCLSSTFPMNIIWGPESIQIYNDGYRVCCGDAHPRALGEDYRVTWASAWPAIGESFDRAWAGERKFLENQRMFLKRLNGQLEETFFTFSHSPIQDESGRVGGLFHPVTETTATMLAERRMRALRDLTGNLAVATDEADVARRAEDILARFEFDLPFVLYYVFDPQGGQYRLAAYSGIGPGTSQTALSVAPDSSRPWPFAKALTASSIIEADDLPSSILKGVTCGPYEEPPNRAFVIPILVPAAEQAPAVIVTGASSRLPLNADYRSFYDLLGVTIAGALSAVRAREDERRRAEALAEIDRAKTLFFSNVSHEFRTPLTLMLGPLEDLKGELGRADALVSANQYQQIDLAHRNGLRLLKLVNTLLDFSRLEAGRMQAFYEPTDLAAATAELASVFRSAIEQAGLRLLVDCMSLSEAAYIDREMWEKIVLNLLSNAFKFTFEGEIEVRSWETNEHFAVAVRDTGAGIPAHELPKLFERFHRVAGAHGRTHEGSGIGLALVRELVKLHSGTVSVESEQGKGSTFTVVIPRGRSHLPAEQIGAARTLVSTSLGATHFVVEALRWLPETEPGDDEIIADAAVPHRAEPISGERAYVLFADDNADMRDYVRRLLAPRYDVEVAPDGEVALAAIARRKPDLLLSDIMMPRLDGMQLLARLRADPQTSTLPIIFLSARAGEESRVDGMQSGADDYLIKPFSGRELLARVEANVKMARFRNETAETLRASEERYRAFVTASSDVVYRMSPDWSEMRYLLGKEFIADTASPSQSWLQKYIRSDDQPRVMGMVRKAISSKSAFELEHRIIRVDGTTGWTHSRAIPLLGAGGEIIEWFGAARDITERKQAEETQQLLLGELNHRVKNILASVQAIAHHTLRRTNDPAAFAESFAGRIRSLSRVHSLLAAATWKGAELRDVIRDQLVDGAVDETRITAWGPLVHLEPQTTHHVALMLHELGTNALKYGALSAPGGWVTIAWTVEDQALKLRWEERGGPPSRAPATRGFGTILIEQSARVEGGSARMLTTADGVVWEITLQLLRPLGKNETTSPSAFELVRQPLHVTDMPPGKLSGDRFLVIEDEPLLALDISAGLQEAHAEVVASTGSASEALDIIESQPLDAALLDGDLKGRPVDDIAAALTRRKVPFAFVTGYGRESLPRAFGTATLLAKPFSQPQLLEVATQLVERAGVVRLKGK